jgi:hypothetical protein
VHTPERARDRLERARDRGVLRRLRLQRHQRLLHIGQGCFGVGRHLCPAGPLDLVESAHRLGDRRGQIEQVLRNIWVGLKSVETTSQRFSCNTCKRNGVGHGFLAPRFHDRW